MLIIIDDEIGIVQKLILITLALCLSASALAAQNSLYGGLKVAPTWIDARGGELRTAAGGSLLAAASYDTGSFYTAGRAGWMNMIGDPMNFQAVEIGASVGVARGYFIVYGDLSRLWYFAGRSGGDTLISLGGEFYLPVWGGRVRLSAGGRGGFAFTEYTTYVGAAYVAAHYRISE